MRVSKAAPTWCWCSGGNRLHHQNVRWLSEQLTTAGYRTHTVQIPDIIGDFEREYLAPVRE